MFAVLTHSRLRDVRAAPAMLRATLEIRRELRRTRGLLRAANVIAGPTEFVTLTLWSDRDAMHAFVSGGAHERIMWRWPEWLRAFWLGRLTPLGDEHGSWRGLRVSPVADVGGPAHARFVAPAFASHQPRPRDLEPLGLGVALCVIEDPGGRAGRLRLLSRARPLGRAAGGDGVLARAGGYSLDGEIVGFSICRDAERARAASLRMGAQAPRGARAWTMVWRPVDEFGTWDGDRMRLLAARSPGAGSG